MGHGMSLVMSFETCDFCEFLVQSARITLIHFQSARILNYEDHIIHHFICYICHSPIVYFICTCLLRNVSYKNLSPTKIFYLNSRQTIVVKILFFMKSSGCYLKTFKGMDIKKDHLTNAELQWIILSNCSILNQKFALKNVKKSPVFKPKVQPKYPALQCTLLQDCIAGLSSSSN